jgi:hypothetical protein
MGPVAAVFSATGRSIRAALANALMPHFRGTRAPGGRNQHARWARWGGLMLTQLTTSAEEVKKSGTPGSDVE